MGLTQNKQPQSQESYEQEFQCFFSSLQNQNNPLSCEGTQQTDETSLQSQSNLIFYDDKCTPPYDQFEKMKDQSILDQQSYQSGEHLFHKLYQQDPQSIPTENDCAENSIRDLTNEEYNSEEQKQGDCQKNNLPFLKRHEGDLEFLLQEKPFQFLESGDEQPQELLYDLQKLIREKLNHYHQEVQAESSSPLEEPPNQIEDDLNNQPCCVFIEGGDNSSDTTPSPSNSGMINNNNNDQYNNQYNQYHQNILNTTDQTKLLQQQVGSNLETQDLSKCSYYNQPAQNTNEDNQHSTELQLKNDSNDHQLLNADKNEACRQQMIEPPTLVHTQTTHEIIEQERVEEESEDDIRYQQEQISNIQIASGYQLKNTHQESIQREKKKSSENIYRKVFRATYTIFENYEVVMLNSPTLRQELKQINLIDRSFKKNLEILIRICDKHHLDFGVIDFSEILKKEILEGKNIQKLKPTNDCSDKKGHKRIKWFYEQINSRIGEKQITQKKSQKRKTTHTKHAKSTRSAFNKNSTNLVSDELNDRLYYVTQLNQNQQFSGQQYNDERQQIRQTCEQVFQIDQQQSSINNVFQNEISQLSVTGKQINQEQSNIIKDKICDNQELNNLFNHQPLQIKTQIRHNEMVLPSSSIQNYELIQGNNQYIQYQQFQHKDKDPFFQNNQNYFVTGQASQQQQQQQQQQQILPNENMFYQNCENQKAPNQNSYLNSAYSLMQSDYTNIINNQHHHQQEYLKQNDISQQHQVVNNYSTRNNQQLSMQTQTIPNQNNQINNPPQNLTQFDYTNIVNQQHHQQEYLTQNDISQQHQAVNSYSTIYHQQFSTQPQTVTNQNYNLNLTQNLMQTDYTKIINQKHHQQEQLMQNDISWQHQAVNNYSNTNNQQLSMQPQTVANQNYNLNPTQNLIQSDFTNIVNQQHYQQEQQMQNGISWQHQVVNNYSSNDQNDTDDMQVENDSNYNNFNSYHQIQRIRSNYNLIGNTTQQTTDHPQYQSRTVNTNYQAENNYHFNNHYI